MKSSICGRSSDFGLRAGMGGYSTVCVVSGEARALECSAGRRDKIKGMRPTIVVHPRPNSLGIHPLQWIAYPASSVCGPREKPNYPLFVAETLPGTSNLGPCPAGRITYPDQPICSLLSLRRVTPERQNAEKYRAHNAMIANSLNMERANADLRELTQLYAAQGLDLAERLRRLEDAGTVTFQVDRMIAISAGDQIAIYKLVDELLADPAAMRARDVHLDNADESHGQFGTSLA